MLLDMVTYVENEPGIEKIFSNLEYFSLNTPCFDNFILVLGLYRYYFWIYIFFYDLNIFRKIICS